MERDIQKTTYKGIVRTDFFIRRGLRFMRVVILCCEFDIIT